MKADYISKHAICISNTYENRTVSIAAMKEGAQIVYYWKFGAYTN